MTKKAKEDSRATVAAPGRPRAEAENTLERPAETEDDAALLAPEYGDQDEEAPNGPVRKLQRFLRDQGLYKGRIDGDYRDKTLAAVNAYRLSKGLPTVANPAGDTPVADAAVVDPGNRPPMPTVDDYKKPSGTDPTKHGSNVHPISDEQRRALFGSYRFRPFPAPDTSGASIVILADAVTGKPWEDTHIAQFQVPQLVGVPLYDEDGTPFSGNIRFHRMLKDQLLAAFAALESEGLMKHVLTFDGAFVPRYVRGSRTSLSNHAYGTALDINANWNGLHHTPAAVGEKGSVRLLVPVFEHFGFYWGGYGWGSERWDGMHFEAAAIAGL